MSRRFPQPVLSLPEWVESFIASHRATFDDDEDKAALVIELSRRNVANGTGGPFGAAVFDLDSHVLIAPGVNLVEATDCSAAHAEMVALTLAQGVLGTYDLSAPGLPRCELVSSADPCVMCLGGVHWSGVRRLVCAADREDAERAGFDEGPVGEDWTGELERRGCEVRRGVLRSRAAGVLGDYASGGNVIYNPSPRDH